MRLDQLQQTEAFQQHGVVCGGGREHSPQHRDAVLEGVLGAEGGRLRGELGSLATQTQPTHLVGVAVEQLTVPLTDPAVQVGRLLDESTRAPPPAQRCAPHPAVPALVGVRPLDQTQQLSAAENTVGLRGGQRLCQQRDHHPIGTSLQLSQRLAGGRERRHHGGCTAETVSHRSHLLAHPHRPLQRGTTHRTGVVALLLLHGRCAGASWGAGLVLVGVHRQRQIHTTLCGGEQLGVHLGDVLWQVGCWVARGGCCRGVACTGGL
mmetsp:Transcript_4748/g.14484  ORF Transcript_4748/g.14484 Transcript_4748/m.14484 type:complete len:264 (-) Transcript_4748:753-1544(-)